VCRKGGRVLRSLYKKGGREAAALVTLAALKSLKKSYK